MNRMPVAERREQLIGAAMTVASRDGIEAATVRAVAAEAGVSLGVVHYCFQDKYELMRAMAHAITRQNSTADLSGVPAGASADDVVQAFIEAFWQSVSSARGAQLLSYELTTASLRHQELRDVALEQYRGQWSAAEAVLEQIADVANVEWVQPVPEIARAVVAFVDGVSLAWLVDGDDDAARESMSRFGHFLSTRTAPVASASSEA